MKNKGFTLIELLAVIVVLAIILIIAVPRVLRVIEDSDKESFRLTGENLLKGVKDKTLIDSMTGVSTKTYTIEDGAFVDESISMSGELPDSGTIIVKADGSVLMAVKNDKYCLKKRYEEDKVQLVEDPSCELPVSKIYGVRFNNATVGTRTDDAEGLTYTVNTSTITSDFDTAEIYNEIEDYTDTDGNVYVKIPRFYIKKTKSEGNIWTYQISKDRQDIGYYLPESFRNHTNGDILDYVLIGKYNASLNNTKLESKSGTSPLVSQNINTFRTYAKNNGPSYQLIDIHAIDLIQVLFYVEFATLDSTSIMYGYANGNASVISSGTTNSVSTASGSPTSNTSGKYAMKYRGIENLWGNIWQIIDGINIKNNRVYISKNPTNYTSGVFTGDYMSLGYINADVVNPPIEMGYDTNQPYANFPITVGTYTNSIYKDNYYRLSSENGVSFFGGSWNIGISGGVSCWYFGYTPSSAISNLGSRLMKKAF